MSVTSKNILFYNAIPMPHSIMLHKALVEKGYKVNFWYYKDLTTLYPWKSLNSTNEYFVFGKNGHDFRKLVKQTLQSDLVIITGMHTKIHVILAITCYLLRIKYAYWLDVSEKRKRNFKTFINKILLKMADYLFVTGQEGIRRISVWNKLNISKFRDFPYLGAIVDDGEIRELNMQRNKLLMENDKIKILISNRFEKRKGYDCVLKALKTLEVNTLGKYILTILGSGTQFEYYNGLLNDLNMKIDIKHWVEYSDYLKHIKETDILIHASSHEPFGIPPIDAMAHGKLVIVSDGVMSTIDRIHSGENGFVFRANDSVRLAEILKSICDDRKLIYKIGNKAYNDSKNYQIEYNLSVINEIFAS
jgi:glycosyltransferase involved in cell wall biosynthesis